MQAILTPKSPALESLNSPTKRKHHHAPKKEYETNESCYRWKINRRRQIRKNQEINASEQSTRQRENGSKGEGWKQAAH